MNARQRSRALHIRHLVQKYLEDRPAHLRTEEPRPGDYDSFRAEYDGDVVDGDISLFERFWAQEYDKLTG